MVNVPDDVLHIDLVYENVPPTCTLCGLLRHERNNKENSDESRGRSKSRKPRKFYRVVNKESQLSVDGTISNPVEPTIVIVSADFSKAIEFAPNTIGENNIPKTTTKVADMNARDMENHFSSYHVSSVEHSPEDAKGDFEPMVSKSMHKKIKVSSKNTGATTNQILTRGLVMNHVS
ncbi:hypothetical protein LWI28_021277 [Acer negundo]|uniref:Uncharacterized protein n=1 Tax=Acer negundo TaxID=4023 RepID=A0AAD5NM15_ACENE|nr:hypothetical protein LWI28_021277 [Acer negundo]